MLKKIQSKTLIISFSTALLALIVIGCGGGGGSSTSGSGSSGNLNPGDASFSYTRQLPVSNGSVQQVALILNRDLSSATVSSLTTNGVQSLQIVSDNPKIASLTPSSCQLSNQSPYCIINVSGRLAGNANVLAISNGVTINSLSTTVAKQTFYGNLGVESSLFPNAYPLTMESGGASNQINIKFSSYTTQFYQGQNDMPSGNYYLLYVTGGLLYSSGITSANPGYFNVGPQSNVFTTQGYGYHANGQGRAQCTANGITSNSPLCTLTFLVPESAVTNKLPVTLNAQIAGEIAPNYQSVTLNATPDPTPYPGTVKLGVQSTNIPLNMRAPIFLNWTNVAMAGTIGVKLTSSSSNVQFYNYSVTNDTVNESVSQTANCTLQFPQTATMGTTGNFGLSCGFGLKGIGYGSAVISAQVTSQNVQGWTTPYVISPVTVTVVNQEPAIRTIVVTNNATESIALGITTGGASAYTSPSTTSVIPNAVTSQAPAPGGGSMCGINNTFAACPIGSTCRPGGLNPGNQTPFFCYYDTPNVSNYIMNPSNGTATVAISGSSGSGDPSGIIWSGNFFSRTKCNSSTGVCQNGTCGQNGMACNPGTGGAPGVMTLSETTFQRSDIGPDYYDVSIINGLNVANAFGPTDATADVSNAYLCGMAGSFSAQAGGWPGSNGGLPASPWTVTPNNTTISPFPVGTTPSGDANSYFRWVSYASTQPTSCTTDTTCTVINPNYRCGFIIATLENASQISNQTIPINELGTSYTRYCGTPISWITADSFYGFESNPAGASNLPFNLTRSFAVNPSLPVTPPQSSITVGNLQLCNYNTYSASGTVPAGAFGNTALACGGVNWETSGITRVSQPPTTSNPNWVANVQPTISWLKQTCPTCYTYPFDDMASTFTCDKAANYSITISNPPQ